MRIRGLSFDSINLQTLLGFVGLTSLVTIALGIATFASSERLMEVDQTRDEILSLQKTVLHYDEILTMSARMAAATGDTAWETRYRTYEPLLDQTIKKLVSLEPEKLGLAEETDLANAKLVDMENRAFALVRGSANKSKEASALLSSPEYEMQKYIYSKGMNGLQAKMSELAARDLNDHRNLARCLALSVTVFLILSFLGWLAVATLSRRSSSRLKELNEHILRLQETERSRIAQEIHDDASQQLSAAKIWLAKVDGGSGDAGASILTGEGAHAVRETRSLIDSTLAKLRNLSHSLHPSMIGNLGLDAAIEWNLKQVAEPAKLSWDFLCDCQEALGELNREKQLHVYRVIQEAIQNVQKHARASAVIVRIQRDHAKIVVDILDDGIGIQTARKGLGFFTMQERAFSLGGKFSTESPVPASLKGELGVPMGAAGTWISFEFPG